MALDDYGYGKGLFDLIKSGQLKESELDNSEKVKLRSYKITRTGKGVQDLLDAGRMTPEEVDNDPELKLGLQAYNTQRELDKSGTQRFAEALPETLGEAAQGIAKGAAQFPGAGLPKPKQIDLEKAINESEPSAVQQFVGERLPQGVVDYLGDIQPALARGGEYFTGEALKLPKTREPNTIDELVGFAIGVTPQILATGKAVGPAVEGLVTKYGLSSYQSGIVQSLIANLLGTAARTGVEDYFRPPEERQGFTGQMEEIGQLSALDIAGGAVGAGLQKGAAALRRAPDYTQPITIDTIVPGLRDAFRKAEATLAGTPDALPPGFVDEAINSIEIEAQKAFRAAVQEAGPEFQAPRAPTEPAKKPATKTQPRVVIPEEFQTPETRRTPLEQEFGLPKGSETGEAPEPAPQEAVKTPPEAQVAPPRAEVPENRAEVPPKAPEPPKETYGLEDKHIQALKDREADARVIADIEERYGISIARKAKSEVLDADKVAAASDEITAGRTPKDTKLTRAERKADPALENLLNNRAQKNARKAAREAGVSDEDFKALRNNLGESAIAEETASGAISARRERVVRTILDKSTSIDDDTRALLRSELEDVQKSRTAPRIEQPVAEKTQISNKPVTKKDIFSDKKIPLGASEEVVTPANTKAKTKFAVADASDLKTSFDEGFPPELQNRLRGTRITSTAQIEEIVSKFDAKRLGSSREVGSGSPVVDREGNVLVGNGRTTAIRRVLAQDDLPAGEYRDFIKENAEKFGIDPKRVDDLDNPILVRVLDEDVEGPKFISEANKPTAQVLSATEKALDDAKKLSDETLALIRPDDLELNESTEFINKFAKEVVDSNEMNAFVDSQGGISAEGKRRVRNAVFAKAFDDVNVIESVVESTDPDYKNIGNALFNTSPAFAKTKGGKFHIGDKLTDALDQLLQAKKRGIELRQQLSQKTIGLKEPDKTTKALAVLFDQNKTKPVVLQRFLETLAEATERAEAAAGQTSMFGGDKINPDDILEAVVRKVADEGHFGAVEINGAVGGKATRGKVANEPVKGTVKAPKRARESAAISQETIEEFAGAQSLGDTGDNPRAFLDNTSTHTITRGPSEREKFISDNTKEAAKILKEQSEEGALKISLPKPGGEPPVRALDADVEAVLTASKGIHPFFDRLESIARGNFISKNVKALFEYEPLIQGEFKHLEPTVRRFLDKWLDVVRTTREGMLSVVHPMLKDKTKTARWFNIFERYLTVQNEIFNGKNGLRMTRDIPLKTWESELAHLETMMTPEIKKALELHKQYVQLNWKELVYERGLHPSPTSPNEWYVPREVLDYAGRWTEFAGRAPRSLMQPSRSYLKARGGSVRDIKVDYFDTMSRAVSRLEMDKAVEDFAKEMIGRTAVSKDDMLKAVAETWMMSPEEVLSKITQKNGKVNYASILRPGAIYHIGDKAYKVFRFNPSRDVYSGSPTEKFMHDVLETLDMDASIASARNDIRALLPINIAERLDKFNVPKDMAMVEQVLRATTSAWKEITLNYAFIPYQFKNILGDAYFAYYLEDPRAMKYIWRAFQAVRNGQKGQYDEVYEKMIKERLTTAGIAGDIGLDPHDNRFNAFFPTSKKLGHHLKEAIKGNPFNIMRTLNEWREGTIRGSVLLRLEEQVQKGIRPKLKLADIEKIAMDDIPGVGAREITIDYNKVTPEYARTIRQGLFPFATFALKSSTHHVDYLRRAPLKESTAKLFMPYLLMQAYNNTFFSKYEDQLASYRRFAPHVWLPWTDDKGVPYNLQFDMPFNTILAVTGMNEAAGAIADYVKGKITPEEAFNQWIKAVPNNIFKESKQLLNPFIGAALEISFNRDSFSGKDLIKPSERGTPVEKTKIMEYVLKRIMLPAKWYYTMGDRTPESFRPENAFGISGLSLETATGVRSIDLKKEHMAKESEKAQVLQEEVNIKMYRLIDAYTEWQTTGDKQAWLGELERIKNEPGPKPTPEQIKRRLRSKEVQKDIALKKWRQADTPKEKQQYEDEWYHLRELDWKEKGKKRPKAIRPYLQDQTDGE